MPWEKIAQIASAAGLLLTGIGFFLNWWENRRNHRLTFFAEYTGRYQKIMIALPHTAFGTNFDPDQLDKSEREIVLTQMLAYFSLCSEEYDLKSEGYVKQRIWLMWQDGIIANLKKPAFQWGWAQVKEHFVFFPDFYRWVEQWTK